MTENPEPGPRYSPSYTIDVVVEYSGWHNLEFELNNYITKVATLSIEYSGISIPSSKVEICILLTEDSRVQQLNFEHRQKDQPTNVLSFPQIDLNELGSSLEKQSISEYLYLGDIAISYQRINEESVENDKSFKEHLTHIIIHGVLHLLGFDHKEEKEAELMESLESELMLKLSYNDPYIT